MDELEAEMKGVDMVHEDNAGFEVEDGVEWLMIEVVEMALVVLRV